MTHHFSFRHIAVCAVMMTMAMGLLSACTKNAPAAKDQAQDSTTVAEAAPADATPADATPKDGEDMKAPKIEADANGFITLAQCPTKYEGLKVVVSDDVMKASIYRGDELIQTVSGTEDDPLATDGDKSVHFMDANFDGYVDIFIGAGASRTYSSLLLWDPAAKKFISEGVADGSTLQNFTLHPASKSVFEGGSDSAYAEYYSRNIWENNALKKVEELFCVYEPEQYGSYNVNAPYTIKDTQGKTTGTFKKAEELPGQWKALFSDR